MHRHTTMTSRSVDVEICCKFASIFNHHLSPAWWDLHTPTVRASPFVERDEQTNKKCTMMGAAPVEFASLMRFVFQMKNANCKCKSLNELEIVIFLLLLWFLSRTRLVSSGCGCSCGVMLKPCNPFVYKVINHISECYIWISSTAWIFFGPMPLWDLIWCLLEYFNCNSIYWMVNNALLCLFV